MTRSWEDVRAEMEAKAHANGFDLESARERAHARDQAYVLGYRLGELRQRAGLTQVQLAALMQVSQSRISQMERGHLEQLEIDTVRRYVGALGWRMRIIVDFDQHDDDERNREDYRLPPNLAIIA